MQISGSVALVTGANRGLGEVFARELIRRGAAKVYGAARNPAAVTEPGVTPVRIDVTDAGQVAGAARQCPDVGLLVNNSGQVEVLADERSRFVKESLPRDHDLIYPPIQEFWDAAVAGTGSGTS